MKINITEAMNTLLEEERFKGGYSVVSVQLIRFGDGEEKLQWQLYTNDNVSKTHAWSDKEPTFGEALESLKREHDEASAPKADFVE